MIRKLVSFALIACLFLCGFFLPDAIGRLSDWRIETDPVFTVFCPEEEFSYIGTLEDRLYALTGYENLSVDFEMKLSSDWKPDESLPIDVNSLFPDLGNEESSTRNFILSHKTVPVSFRYQETEIHAPGGSVRMVWDEETGKILRLSVTGAQESLRNWSQSQTYSAEGFQNVTGVDAYALLRQYAYLNGFSEITDLTDGNSYGGSALTVKADVREHPYSVCLTFSEPAGMIYYRLIQTGGK